MSRKSDTSQSTGGTPHSKAEQETTKEMSHVSPTSKARRDSKSNRESPATSDFKVPEKPSEAKKVQLLAYDEKAKLEIEKLKRQTDFEKRFSQTCGEGIQNHFVYTITYIRNVLRKLSPAIQKRLRASDTSEIVDLSNDEQEDTVERIREQLLAAPGEGELTDEEMSRLKLIWPTLQNQSIDFEADYREDQERRQRRQTANDAIHSRVAREADNLSMPDLTVNASRTSTPTATRTSAKPTPEKVPVAIGQPQTESMKTPSQMVYVPVPPGSTNLPPGSFYAFPNVDTEVQWTPPPPATTPRSSWVPAGFTPSSFMSNVDTMRRTATPESFNRPRGYGPSFRDEKQGYIERSVPITHHDTKEVVVCWKCREQGHFARDCPHGEEIVAERTGIAPKRPSVSLPRNGKPDKKLKSKSKKQKTRKSKTAKKRKLKRESTSSSSSSSDNSSDSSSSGTDVEYHYKKSKRSKN